MTTMNKWELEENDLIRRRMSKTNEELAELLKVTSRILLQGINGADPETGESNREQLLKEIADVYAQLDCTVKSLYVDWSRVKVRRGYKVELMKE